MRTRHINYKHIKLTMKICGVWMKMWMCVLKKPLSLAAGKAVDRGKKRKVIVYGFLAKVVY